MQSKRIAISLLMALVMLVTPVVPVFADVDAAQADPGGNFVPQYSISGSMSDLMTDLVLSNEGGTPYVIAYPSSYDYKWYPDYNDGFGYGDWLAPLTPAYNMDWTEAGVWDVGDIYHWFTLGDNVHLTGGGVELTSGEALDYTSGRKTFEVHHGSVDGTQDIDIDIAPYFPKLAYDEDAVEYLQLVGGNGSDWWMDREIFAANAVASPGAAGGGYISEYGEHMVWPEYVEPEYFYDALGVALSATPGAVTETYGKSDWRLKIEDSNGFTLKEVKIGADDTIAVFSSLRFEPGEYIVKLIYVEAPSGGIGEMRVEALTAAKFVVEDYIDFKSFSIDGVDGVIRHYTSSNVEVVMPEGTDLTDLKPVFTVADGTTVSAYVDYNGVPQVSGETSVDFSNTVYYILKSPRQQSEIWVPVIVSTTQDYSLLGEIKYIDKDSGEIKAAANATFELLDYSSQATIAAIETDADGVFNTTISYADKRAKYGFLLGAHDEYGKPVNVENGRLIGATCLINPDTYTKITYGRTYSENYTIRGIAKDENGVPLPGAVASWDGVDWATSGAGGGFEFDFDNHWQWNSYGFTLNKAGYQSGYFNVQTNSTRSALSIIRNGYIDLGVITLRSIPTTANGADIAVYTLPNHSQRGKTIEVRVKYVVSDADVAGARISAAVPAGVKILDGTISNSDAYIDLSSNSVVLNQDLTRGETEEFAFWIRAEESYSNNYFTVDAELRDGSTVKALGTTMVTLSDITIDIPAEIGIDGLDSKAFTVKGEASAIEDYTIDISVTDMHGTPYAATADTDITGISAVDNGPWYRVNGFQIKDINTTSGAFLVTASLKDGGGATVSEDVKVIFVREDALELKDIHLYTANADIYATPPVTNSSYIAASIFVDSNYNGRYPLNLSTSWKKIPDLTVTGTSIKYIMQTNLGVFEEEAVVDDPTSETTILKTVFNTYSAGVYRGFSTGHIYLEITRPGARLPIYFHVASLTFLIDPSGYVYDAVTDERISGAAVTLQISKGGIWVDWDAESYAQHNPQTTDEYGAYGWMVPAGEYRVLVEAAGYLPYSTDESEYGILNVPPPQDQVNIGLEKLTVTTTVGALSGGTIGEAYNVALGTNGTGSLTWSVSEGSLPAGLTLGATTGVISGTPTTVGPNTFKIIVTDGILTSDAKSFSIEISLPPPITVTTPEGSLALGFEGKAYNAVLGTNGTGTLTWIVTDGELPAGLTLDAITGTISGTPTTVGTSTFKISVSDGIVTSDEKEFSIKIERFAVTTTEGALAGGYVSEAYSAALSTNGTGSLTWSVSEGSLPAGLTLGAATGVISGTPTAAGTSSFKITASDGVLTSDPKAFSIRIVNRSYSGGVGGGGGGGGSNPAPVTTKEAIDTDETPGAPLPGGLRFVDVRADDWFYEDVEYVAENGIFTGTSETTFSPLLSITRGMMATVLGRLHGVDASKYTTSSFSDVSASQYYAPYVEWAKESGVVLGVGENRFEPDAGITRQDIAVMITRYAEFANKQFPVTLKYNIFADANEIGDYAKNAVDTLCNANIINGIGGNLFNPKGLATRAEVSAILHRFILAANLQSGTAAEAVSEAEAAAETTTAGAIGTGGLTE